MIRSAQEADKAQIMALVKSILEKEFPADASFHATDDLEKFSEVYQGPTGTFLVAQANGRIVGTLGIKAEDSRTAILRRLFVAPAHRKEGIGLGLLQEALQFCRAKGFREVVIRTSTQMSRAIELCSSLGFKEDGRWNLGSATLVRFCLRLT